MRIFCYLQGNYTGVKKCAAALVLPDESRCLPSPVFLHQPLGRCQPSKGGGIRHASEAFSGRVVSTPPCVIRCLYRLWLRLDAENRIRNLVTGRHFRSPFLKQFARMPLNFHLTQLALVHRTAGTRNSGRWMPKRKARPSRMRC